MKIIIHDLDEKELNKFKIENDFIINAKGCINHCIGCFSCWIKHPTKCIYKDNYSTIVEKIHSSDELVLISKNYYGVYSDSVKRVLERCIGFVHPFFTIRSGRIHHKARYQKPIKLTVYIYGDITKKEKQTLKNLVKANGINLNASEYNVVFINDAKELKNVYVN